jgi:hypothetical protein
MSKIARPLSLFRDHQHLAGLGFGAETTSFHQANFVETFIRNDSVSVSLSRKASLWRQTERIDNAMAVKALFAAAAAFAIALAMLLPVPGSQARQAQSQIETIELGHR